MEGPLDGGQLKDKKYRDTEPGAGEGQAAVEFLWG